MHRWLPLFSVSRPVTVVMLAAAFVVLGAIALHRIPLDLLPSGFANPYLWISVPWRNATPLETEARITRPMEEELSTVGGVKHLSSKSGTGEASVELEFQQSVDMAVAYNQVVDRMERVMATLPPDADRYWVYRWNPTDEPIVWAGLTFGPEVDDPYAVVTHVLRRALERIPGVGQVEVWGVDEKRVWVDFDREALSAHGVDLGSLLTRLGSDNVQISGGRITDRGSVRYLRSLARYEDLEVLQRFPVAPGITLQDVATVGFRSEPSKNLNRIDGKKAAGMGIYKESGANTVEVARAIRQTVAQVQTDPRMAGFQFYDIWDQGKEIENSLGNLTRTLWEGGIFAVIILYLFLREWRMTLLISACIPFSMLLTVVALYFLGGSMNLLSMMGLMIAVGMVVDNAIVVVETIFQARQGGLGRGEAAVEGTSEVSLAITLSTLTSLVVFLPLMLMSSDAMFSFFMGELGSPVCWALLASLLVALVFAPLSTTLLSPRHIVEDARWLKGLTDRYERWLRATLHRRLDAIVGLVAIGVATVLVPVKAVSCDEENEKTPTEFMVRIQLPAAMTTEEKHAAIGRFEEVAQANRARWGVRFYRTSLREGRTDGRMFVQLVDPQDWPEDALPQAQVLDDVRDRLPEIPGVSSRLGWEDDPMGKRSVSFELYGEDTETLKRLSLEVGERLEQIPGVMGVRGSEDSEGSQEVRLSVDRDAASRHGLTAQSVGQSVSFAMRGTRLRDMWLGGRDVSVYARLGEQDRADLETLLDLPVGNAAAQALPLRAVTHAQVARGWGRIRREDRRTGLALILDLEEGAQGDTIRRAAQEALREVRFPRGYGWEQGRDFHDDEESDEAQKQALLLSVVFVFLLMGVLFESFVLPLAVITTVPMALFGVYWTLYLTRTPLDITAGVGLVVLVGVVVNNGIVLLDLVTRLRKGGMDRAEALVQAGKRRLRPILMTALTTIVGVIPMAVGHDRFLDISIAPMGRVVGGGMTAATVLTLFLVPLVYTLLDDLRAAGRRWLAWVWPR